MAEMEWKTIESAPRDGTLILAAKKSASFVAFPYPLKQRWNGCAWEADDGHIYEPQPTHWMPLPSPPTKE